MRGRGRRAGRPACTRCPERDRPRGRAPQARRARASRSTSSTPEQAAYRLLGPGRVASRRMADGLQASVEKMREAGPGRRRSPRSATTTSGCARARPGCSPRPRSSRSSELPDADALPEPGDRSARARPRRRDQAQRRPRHEHGHDRAKSLLEVKDGLSFLDVIARQVLDAARARRRAAAARADEHLRHARRLAGGARAAIPELDGRRAAGLRPEPGAEAARRRPAAGRVAATTRRSSGRRPATATSTPRCVTSGMLDALLERGYR